MFLTVVMSTVIRVGAVTFVTTVTMYAAIITLTPGSVPSHARRCVYVKR